MRAVVGLGNPGREYADTRHNAGYLLASALADRWGARFGRGHKARTAETTVRGRAVLLVKPETFMNRSGAAVAPLAASAGFNPAGDLLVLSDDWAIPAGTFRLRAQGSAGGHNGLKSIEATLRTRDYARLRIGIGPLPEGVGDPADWVLDEFYEDEAEALNALLPVMMDAVECWIVDGIEAAMTLFNPKGGRKA